MRGLLRSFLRSDTGSVAPTVGLSLFALIAAGGIAFDYARVAAMDTELQDAADQAALAAATQLDGKTDAISRATAAASNLVSNSTRFASDTGETDTQGTSNTSDDTTVGAEIGIEDVTFYSAFTSASSNTTTTTDADAHFVQVRVKSRRTDYAFTPIVAAFSGSLEAKAVAGLGSAVCGVVPFFICNPVEPATNTDIHLSPGGVEPGKGIVLGQGGTQWGPGNFGFLDQLGNGANGVAEALASDSLFGNCSPTSSVTTETGNILNAVRDSLNMRFDFKSGNASACKNAPCSPSSNAVKDVVKAATGCSWTVPAMNLASDVTSNNSPVRYFPRDNAALPSTVVPQTMGYPRDFCHYFLTSGNSGTYTLCPNRRVGNGSWDRDAYFRVNHPGLVYADEPGLGANVTRYQTYLWEAEDPSRLPVNKTVGANTQYSSPQSTCLAPGVDPNPSGTDRRRITAAVVNCHAAPNLNGKRTLTVAGFIDVFLVEPSIARRRCDGTNSECPSSFTASGSSFERDYGSANDIYVEVIGAAGTGEGGQFPQITRRDVPRLIE
ncbi:MAG TPA: pilus assembly protein TadG-related protein [Sphingomicrobium sp.]|nr:pilus assembly protein TadG-related protein [Sphingomicrobium sp.]